MNPHAVKRALDRLRLSVREAAPLLGISVSQLYKNMREVDDPDYRFPTVGTIRLLKAYEAGYRPKDWPATARKARKPIKEMDE